MIITLHRERYTALGRQNDCCADHLKNTLREKTTSKLQVDCLKPKNSFRRRKKRVSVCMYIGLRCRYHDGKIHRFPSQILNTAHMLYHSPRISRARGFQATANEVVSDGISRELYYSLTFANQFILQFMQLNKLIKRKPPLA